MSGYGQFCAVARSLEILGGRWTLLVVRELLCGARRFNDIRRGIPRISRTMLVERLQALAEAGVVARAQGPNGPEYALTPAGAEIAAIVQSLGVWGQRWLPRQAVDEDLDLDPLLLDMARRARRDALPPGPMVVRIDLRGHPVRFLSLMQGEATACARNPGFPEPLILRGPLHALVGWWRGDFDFAGARHRGLALDGPQALARAFPGWFERYLFAGVPAAFVVGGPDSVP